jgi:class 3 adenylate cyclase
MSTEIKKEIQLEIAHVLFIDIVGYSKLSINEQRSAVDELTQIVLATEQFQKAEAADRLIKIATGDGMVLVFYTSPEAPVRCAVELSRALKDHPHLRVRMGIHSGPVSGVVDVTARTNLAGAGLNLARRVMDCGDAGHILLSKHVAEDLAEFEEWRPLLHDLGTCKPVVRRRGQPSAPTKVSSSQETARPSALGRSGSCTAFTRRHRSCFRSGFQEISKIDINCSGKKYRGAAVRKPKPRSGQRLFCRWRPRRSPDAPGKDRGFESDFARFDTAVSDQTG